ncbi:MAG: CsgG/HfaB family protein [Treponema sp.]|jgi:hypothetical protein|nr:CsgG/HfaB family protein [Treponema sp.]
MKRIAVFVIAALCAACGSLGSPASSGGMARQAGANESELIIQRAAMPVNAGFKERIYIDGVERLVLNNGGQGKIIVPNGEHTIHAELYTLSTDKLPFTADSNALTFLVSPYSIHDFTIEQLDAAPVQTVARTGASPAPAGTPSPARPAAVNAGGIEGSLARAAEKVMVKLSPQSKLAIVYVTARDPDIAEFIANELEYIMVEQGLTLIDRSQLDRIRNEQNFQLSGEVDDAQAVSIGKIAGANVILTGAVTGTGDIRRLRLRALDTQSAQVLVATSERY